MESAEASHVGWPSPVPSPSAGIDLIEWLRIDDPIGVVAVHGFCGIFGTLSIGLFAAGLYGVPGPAAAAASTSTSVGSSVGEKV